MGDLNLIQPAKLRKRKTGWVIEYIIYDSRVGKIKRKTISLSNIPYKDRTAYAKELIENINKRLLYVSEKNEINNNCEFDYKLKNACNFFLDLKKRELKHFSYTTYKKKINLLFVFLQKKQLTDIYLSQFDRQLAIEFLDYLYIEKKISEVYYNKTLSFFITLWNFFVERYYSEKNIFKGLKKKKERQKKRKLFDDEQLQRYFDFLQKNDKWFLFYSYLTFYCFIRPNEIAQLRFFDFVAEKKVVVIRSEIAKNGKRQTVTLTNKLMSLMQELEFEKYPDTWYIFSANKQPGFAKRDPRYIAKKFASIRKKLKLPDNLQFYSLKDTGIVKMLQAGVSVNIVRDQARHYSLEVTNKYVQLANEGAFNEVLQKVKY